MDLAAVYRDLQERLAQAASDRRSPMHVPVVATPDAQVRMMVLREWDAARRTLRFHTDARSPKVAMLGEGAPAGVLFHDAEAKIQIRVRGMGRVETYTPAADTAWEAASNFARRCYLVEAAPGTVRHGPGSGLPTDVEGRKPDDEELVPARENFAILLIEVEEFDWLYLDHAGHRRAIFRHGQEGCWVQP